MVTVPWRDTWNEEIIDPLIKSTYSGYRDQGSIGFKHKSSKPSSYYKQNDLVLCSLYTWDFTNLCSYWGWEDRREFALPPFCIITELHKLVFKDIFCNCFPCIENVIFSLVFKFLYFQSCSKSNIFTSV